MARNTKRRKTNQYIMPFHISGYGNIARLLCYRLDRSKIGFIREMDRCIGRFGRPIKSFGVPEAQIPPQPAQIPKGRFFSPSNSKGLICQAHLRIIRMNQSYNMFLPAPAGHPGTSAGRPLPSASHPTDLRESSGDFCGSSAALRESSTDLREVIR